MLRFTIRDVLWLMLVVAICLGGWRFHESRMQENNQFHWQVLQERLVPDKSRSRPALSPSREEVYEERIRRLTSQINELAAAEQNSRNQLEKLKAASDGTRSIARED